MRVSSPEVDSELLGRSSPHLRAGLVSDVGTRLVGYVAEPTDRAFDVCAQVGVQRTDTNLGHPQKLLHFDCGIVPAGEAHVVVLETDRR